jgi:phosphonatase-like hydrolase
MSLRLAVFDIAGTTIEDDSAVANAFSKAFEMYGFKIQEKDIAPMMGYKKPVAIKIMLEKLGADASKQLVDNIHREFEIEMVDHYEYSPDVKAMPGAETMFLKLKEKGIRVALNTGFSKVIADTILSRMQWKEKGLVDDYIASSEVELGRPHAFMIQELMQRAGIHDPGEVIKIGDTEVDVNEGRNAGCALVIAVTTGAFDREELEPYSPDYIIDSLDELPDLIFGRG